MPGGGGIGLPLCERGGPGGGGIGLPLEDLGGADGAGAARGRHGRGRSLPAAGATDGAGRCRLHGLRNGRGDRTRGRGHRSARGRTRRGAVRDRWRALTRRRRHRLAAVDLGRFERAAAHDSVLGGRNLDSRCRCGHHDLGHRLGLDGCRHRLRRRLGDRDDRRGHVGRLGSRGHHGLLGIDIDDRLVCRRGRRRCLLRRLRGGLRGLRRLCFLGLLGPDQPVALGPPPHAVGLRLFDARRVALDADAERDREIERLLVGHPELFGQLVEADLCGQGCGQPFGWG